jgi:hypothetical protein
MLLIIDDFEEKLNNFYKTRLDRLKEIQSLEFKERFAEVKNDFGFAPMLEIKRFLLHTKLLKREND